MHLFYSTSIHDTIIELAPDESKHLVRVLRLKEGDQVQVIDGKGNTYLAAIQQANPKKAVLTVLEKELKDESFLVEIAAAPTKNSNRWEWFLEKATEIGIDAIHPILSSNSERKVVKRERQERILISAMKQSYKATLPQLSDLTPFQELVKRDFEGEKFIAHCYDDLTRSELKSRYTKGQKALILIGPEGDFSKDEVELALKHGFIPISMGQSRLRTETAALVACHTINLLNA